MYIESRAAAAESVFSEIYTYVFTEDCNLYIRKKIFTLISMVKSVFKNSPPFKSYGDFKEIVKNALFFN